MGKIVIDEDRCKGCELCINVCPYNLIGTSKKLNSLGFHPASFISPDGCSGCAQCAIICPDIAIEVYK